MSTALLRISAIALIALIPVLAGCLERKEHLRILPDGFVEYRVEHQADAFDEIFGLDALPTPAGGWIVNQSKGLDPQGKQRFTFTAERMFPPSAPLPENFAPPGDPDVELYLQFPTSIVVEERRDGVYYHFRRVYLPRPWAQIELLQQLLVESPLKELHEIDPGEWTPQQRVKVVDALAEFELEKTLTFARKAFLELTPDLPQDGWLLVRDDALAFLRELDRERLAKLLQPRETQTQEEQRTGEIEAETKELQAALRRRLANGLRSLANYNGSQLAQFQARYDRFNKAHEITSALGSQRLTITVEMPGELVAHNGQADGNQISWVVEGTMIRDREVELLATSRVPR